MRIGLTCIALAVFLAGCSHNPARIPEVQPIPLFRKPGEIHVTASLQADKGLQAGAGMAVGKSVAVMAGGAYGQQDNCFSCSKEVSRHAEAAVGTYRKLDDRTVGEAYIGGGLGRFRTLGNSGRWDPSAEDIVVSAGRYHAGFLQGNIGRTGRWFDKALSARVSAYRFYGFGQWDGDAVPRPAPESHLGVFLEPALTLRAGYKQVKATGQLGLSVPLIQEKGLDNRMAWLSLGLGFSLFGN